MKPLFILYSAEWGKYISRVLRQPIGRVHLVGNIWRDKAEVFSRKDAEWLIGARPGLKLELRNADGSPAEAFDGGDIGQL